MAAAGGWEENVAAGSTAAGEFVAAVRRLIGVHLVPPWKENGASMALMC